MTLQSLTSDIEQSIGNTGRFKIIFSELIANKKIMYVI